MTQILQFQGKGGIIHATVGNEHWEPSVEDLEVVQSLIHAADCDPKGAVLVTRDGIDIRYLSPEGKPMQQSKFLHVAVSLPNGSPPTNDQLAAIKESVQDILNEYYNSNPVAE